MIEPINNAIDALKASPVTFSMVLMNIGLLVLLGYAVMISAENRKMMHEAQHHVQELLASCRANGGTI